MASEWTETTLGEVVNFRRGHDLPKSKMVNGTIPVVGSNGVIGHHNASTTPAPCITIGRSGNVGKPHLSPVESWAHNTTLYIDDFKGNDPEFVFHFLKTLELESFRGGSAVPTLNRNHIHPIEVTLPPLPEQKAIAHILGSLDDKIELNRRMNETLEGMAQALFKSWFTDFDPVIDNILMKNMAEFLEQNQPSSPLLPEGEEPLDAEQSLALWERLGEGAFKGIPDEFADRARLRQGYAGQAETQEGVPTIGKTAAEFSPKRSADNFALQNSANGTVHVRKLFPDSFQPSELGPIPTGWKVRQVKDFGSVICGKTPPKKNANYYGEDVPFIKIPDMHDSAWITETSDGLSLEGAKSQAKKEIPPNSICVSCIATVGKVVITSRDSHTNQQINSVVPDRAAFRYYLYFAFSGMTKELHDLASGGSATLNLNTGNFSKIQLLSPSDEVMNAYYSSADPLFRKMLAGDFEAQTLTKLRDTLLPKLISGELRLPAASIAELAAQAGIEDAEKMVGGDLI